MIDILEFLKKGKVRDIWTTDNPEVWALVASDRISANNFSLEPEVPDKGRLLTDMADFWFTEVLTDRRTHYVDRFDERTMLVRILEMYPVECIVRGHITGSGWKSYLKDGTICGIQLPPGLQKSQELEYPIFTPTTKDKDDSPLTWDEFVVHLGGDEEMAEVLRDISLTLFLQGRDHCRKRGIIIADTKFEFGHLPGEDDPILADEVFTMDSSRFWPAGAVVLGEDPPSFDKQPVRDHLDALKASGEWDGASPPPPLPPEVVAATTARYQEALDLITGPPTAA